MAGRKTRSNICGAKSAGMEIPSVVRVQLNRRRGGLDVAGRFQASAPSSPTIRGDAVKKWFCTQCHQQGKKYFDPLVLNRGKEVWTVCKTCGMGFRAHRLGSINDREVTKKLA